MTLQCCTSPGAEERGAEELASPLCPPSRPAPFDPQNPHGPVGGSGSESRPTSSTTVHPQYSLLPQSPLRVARTSDFVLHSSHLLFPQHCSEKDPWGAPQLADRWATHAVNKPYIPPTGQPTHSGPSGRMQKHPQKRDPWGCAQSPSELPSYREDAVSFLHRVQTPPLPCNPNCICIRGTRAPGLSRAAHQ